MWIFFLFLSLIHADYSLQTPSPEAPGKYEAMPGFYCPVDESDRSSEGFIASFATCIKACNGNTSCFGFNFELAPRPGTYSTCQLVRMPCNNNRSDGQLQPASADTVYYTKGVTKCRTNNAGDDFILAFLSNRPQQSRKKKLELFIASDRRFNITKETVDEEDMKKTVKQTMEVAPNEPLLVEINPLWRMTDVLKTEIIETGVSLVEKKVIKISSKQSSDKFFLVGMNQEHFTADAFLGLPVSSLGKK